MEAAMTDPFAPIDIEVGGPQVSLPDDAGSDEIAIYVSRLGMRAAELRGEMRTNEAEARRLAEPLERRLEIVANWLAEENAAKLRTIAYLEQQIRVYAPRYPYERGKKSRKLPWGKLGSKLVGGALTIIDMDAAVKFAREHGMPVKEEVGKTPLKEYIESTGETLPFVEVDPKRDEYFVEIAEVE
jgi:hypothetical protein